MQPSDFIWIPLRRSPSVGYSKLARLWRHHELGQRGCLLDREIYFYEGVHLGPRVQAWLYDRWSMQYDKGKQESQRQDNEMLAEPLLGALNAARVPEPCQAIGRIFEPEAGPEIGEISISNRRIQA